MNSSIDDLNDLLSFLNAFFKNHEDVGLWHSTTMKERVDLYKFFVQQRGLLFLNENLREVIKLLSKLIEIKEKKMEEGKEEEESETDDNEEPPFDIELCRPIELLGERGLKKRALNALIKDELRYIGDIVQRSPMEILKTPELSYKSLGKIKEILDNMGLELGTKIEGWTEANIKKGRKLLKLRDEAE